MSDDALNHECDDLKAMAFSPDAAHDRQPSTFPSASALANNCPGEQQSPLASQHAVESQPQAPPPTVVPPSPSVCADSARRINSLAAASISSSFLSHSSQALSCRSSHHTSEHFQSSQAIHSTQSKQAIRTPQSKQAISHYQGGQIIYHCPRNQPVDRLQRLLILDRVRRKLFPHDLQRNQRLERICSIVMAGMDIFWDDDAMLAYIEAYHNPPITTESLAELEFARIVQNPKVRHDVNFDRELHFRPNLEGAKGRKKLADAEEYWRALEVELYTTSLYWDEEPVIAAEVEVWNAFLDRAMRRLELLFVVIRDILRTLVPREEQQAVDDRLNVPLLMQQIRRGVCDLVGLARWLADILTRHCAPMRDELVSAMRDEVECALEGDAAEHLVTGLRQLLVILEAMKLDVANHQIRHLRSDLIEDTVKFQRRLNAKRIKTGIVIPHISREWLEEEMANPSFVQDHRPTRLEALSSAFLREVAFNDIFVSWPQTFGLDSDRMDGLRDEMHNAVYHDLCSQIFEELAGPEIDRSQMEDAWAKLQARIIDIVGPHANFPEHRDNIAAEMVRQVLHLFGHTATTSRALLEVTDLTLKEHLHEDSDAYRHIMTQLCERLVPKLRSRVRAMAKRSPTELHRELVSQPSLHQPVATGVLSSGAILTPPPSAPQAPADPDEDFIRRTTHILVLHWQVWANMAYMISPATASPPAQLPTPPPSPSPAS